MILFHQPENADMTREFMQIAYITSVDVYGHQCMSGSRTPGVFVWSCYQDRDDDDDDDDDGNDAAVFVKHAFNTLDMHVFVFIKILSSNTAPDSQQLPTSGPQVKRWQSIVIPFMGGGSYESP